MRPIGAQDVADTFVPGEPNKAFDGISIMAEGADGFVLHRVSIVLTETSDAQMVEIEAPRAEIIIDPDTSEATLRLFLSRESRYYASETYEERRYRYRELPLARRGAA